MNKAGSAAKVKLNSFDDLFGASDMTAGTDQVQEILPFQSFMSSEDTLLRCWINHLPPCLCSIYFQHSKTKRVLYILQIF